MNGSAKTKKARYFHVTPAENLDRIATTGLLPSIRDNSEAAGETVAAVFCFRVEDKDGAAFLEDALSNWALADGEMIAESERKFALLEIEAGNGRFRICPDPVHAGVGMILDPVPFEAVSILHFDIANADNLAEIVESAKDLSGKDLAAVTMPGASIH